MKTFLHYFISIGSSLFSFTQNSFQIHPKIKFAITGETYLTDFELTPPKNIFGFIILKEDIEINFNLIVENTIQWKINLT